MITDRFAVVWSLLQVTAQEDYIKLLIFHRLLREPITSAHIPRHARSVVDYR
jgi:hypothetical protein